MSRRNAAWCAVCGGTSAGGVPSESQGPC